MIVECLVDEHVPPIPATVTTEQVTKLAEAMRQGTPNRNRIALQMVKDMLDESGFEASPGHVIPRRVGKALAGVASRLRNRADADQARDGGPARVARRHP